VGGREGERDVAEVYAGLNVTSKREDGAYVCVIIYDEERKKESVDRLGGHKEEEGEKENV